MSGRSKAEQDLQDQEYWFPYHYVAQFRTGFSDFFLDSWSINYASTMEYLLGRARDEEIARIVDIGCGDGRFTRELALSFPESRLVGIDYSSRAVTLAAAMNQDLRNLEFLSLDITKASSLPPFDMAILMEVFEHIPIGEADHFMAAVRRLLRQRGVLYLTVPHVNKALEYKHFQHFTVETICTYLRPYFDIAEVVPFERRSWRRTIMSKLLSNRLFILSNARLLDAIYRWYKSNLFFCTSESSCQRVFVRAVAK